MRPVSRYLNFHVTALVLLFGQSLAALGEESGSDKLDQLHAELAQPEQQGWQRIEDSIWIEWSRSGSAAMDLLLKQGRAALEAEEYGTAIEHLTALTDHAPDFAEGWNARASAFFQLEMYGPAMEDIRRVLALNPRHFAALTGLAVILEQGGDEEGALEAYRRVMAIHPHRPNVIEAVERLELSVLGKRI